MRPHDTTSPSGAREALGPLTSRWLVAVLVVLGGLPSVAGAVPDSRLGAAGQFFTRSFTIEDYQAGSQNFAVVQGDNDFIYAANANGILEYDGATWRLISLPHNKVVRSLALGEDGRIHVGAINELGYLEPDPRGGMVYVSLLDQIEIPADQELGQVLSIARTSDGVYFQTVDRLIRWNGSEIRVWEATTGFLFCFTLHDALYVQQQDIGLARLHEDGFLQPTAHDATVRDTTLSETSIRSLLPWHPDSFLAVTRRHGIFQCPLEQATDPCQVFSPETQHLLSRLQLLHAAVSPDGYLILSTFQGGAILLDRDGSLLRVIDKSSGLPSATVLRSHLDRQGGLWLALNNGLARVEIHSPVSYWSNGATDEPEVGIVLDIEQHRERLWAATSLGLFRMVPGTGGAPPSLGKISGIADTCYSLLSTPRGLLAGCIDGLHDVDRGVTLWKDPVLKIAPDRHDPALFYLGLEKGLATLRLIDGAWGQPESSGSIDLTYTSSIVEDRRGNLWLGSRNSGVSRVAWRVPGQRPEVTRFGSRQGLPDGPGLVLDVAGQILVYSDGAGFFRPDSEHETMGFVAETSFDDFLESDRSSIDYVGEDHLGRLWIAADQLSGVAHPVDGGGYRWEASALRRAPMGEVFSFYAAPDGSVWLGSTLSGLIRVDTDRPFAGSSDYSVRIRRIRSTGGEPRDDRSVNDTPTTWSYEENTKRFEFAAPRYDAPDQTEYRVRLEGLEGSWSTWTKENHKEYTNLWEGDYVFRVQARDVYGVLSAEDTYAFTVLPPWHRTPWAYGFYALWLAGTVWGAYRVAYRTQQRKIEREQRVNHQLREVDRLKDEFLAATSHELRTPLYGITGLAESLTVGVKGQLPASVQDDLDMIVSSGRRLSRLVDDMLDFAKMRRAGLALEQRPVELHALADVVLALSRPLASGKHLALINAVPTDLPMALADENRVQQILHNLVGNAIKFTDSGHVEVRARQDHLELIMEVADTGIGVGEEHRERIFESFEQAEGGVDRRHGGTGLGLAISRQLVELHGGELRLADTSTKGSTFTFTLPIAETAHPASARATKPVDRHAITASAGPTSDPEPRAIRTPPPTEPPRTGDARILVVDDEPVNLQVVHNYLKAEGFTPTLVSSGQEALQRLTRERFDLVLLDVMMPRLSGYEVCRTLRERYPIAELPVIFLTAQNQDADIEIGLAEGGNDFLVKPISGRRLVARLRPHLEMLAVHRDLEDLVEQKLSQIKVLSGLLPICAGCQKVRDDQGYWDQLEDFISRHSEAEFSHGICPTCARDLYGVDLYTLESSPAEKT